MLNHIALIHYGVFLCIDQRMGKEDNILLINPKTNIFMYYQSFRVLVIIQTLNNAVRVAVPSFRLLIFHLHQHYLT